MNSVKSPCDLRHLTSQSASDHTLSAIVSRALKPSLTAIQTTNDTIGDNLRHSEPFRQAAHPLTNELPFRENAEKSRPKFVKNIQQEFLISEDERSP